MARGRCLPRARRLPLRRRQGVKGGGEVGHLGPAADAGHGLRVEEHVLEPLLQKALNQLLHDVGATTLPHQNPTDEALNGGPSQNRFRNPQRRRNEVMSIEVTITSLY